MKQEELLKEGVGGSRRVVKKEDAKFFKEKIIKKKYNLQKRILKKVTIFQILKRYYQIKVVLNSN